MFELLLATKWKFSTARETKTIPRITCDFYLKPRKISSEKTAPLCLRTNFPRNAVLEMRWSRLFNLSKMTNTQQHYAVLLQATCIKRLNHLHLIRLESSWVHFEIQFKWLPQAPIDFQFSQMHRNSMYSYEIKWLCDQWEARHHRPIGVSE